MASTATVHEHGHDQDGLNNPLSPLSSGRQSPSRKETILSLVEMLLQESGHAARVKAQTPSFEDDRDVPSVDEYLQDAGAEAFNKFQRSINALDKELRNFANAARQLGSSVAILSSAFRLRERIAQLLWLYRENAADLFPRKVSHMVRESATIDQLLGGRKPKASMRKKAHLHTHRPIIAEDLDPEGFPDLLEDLAEDVKTFLNCLNEFPEFTDEAVNASILSFEGDLKYWSSCLREYTNQFRYPAVQRYIHELSQEMGDHINGITSSLRMFIEVGVPTIRFAQKHGSTNLLNLSTIATFFSAVTATTMQFSYELEPKLPLSAAVNSFWFASLVFSIAAAVNSLLGLTWKQAMYRSPGHRVPWWVLIWIKRSPLVFLVLSVACFSVGLCVFSYASEQAPITSTLTTVLTAFTSFGLAAVSAWFASERWAFSRHRGQKWLSDVLGETMTEFVRYPGISWIYGFCRFLSRHFVKLHRLTKHAVEVVSDTRRWCCRSGGTEEDPDDVELGSASARTSETKTDDDKYTPKPEMKHARKRLAAALLEDSPTTPMTSRGSLPTSPLSPRGPPPVPVTSPVSPVPPTPANPASETPTVTSPLSILSDGARPAGAPGAPSHGKLLWKNAIRTIKMHNNLNATGGTSSAMPFNLGAMGGGGPGEASGSTPRPIPVRKDTGSSSIAPGPDRSATTIVARRGMTLGTPEPISTVKSRLSALMPKLLLLEATQDLPAHSALVRHVQFSPDGKYMATSSWDKTSVIFEVGDPFVSHRTLGHTHGFVGQVAWSPTGNILLTKLARGIKVWTAEDGVCRKMIDRKVQVETLTWMPDGESFLSVEGSSVTRLNLRGAKLAEYDFGNLKLHDVAVLPDMSRIIGVGPLRESPTGLQPSKSRVEKRLVVYNIQHMTIESSTPVLNDVRDITIAEARSGIIALISYENKAPPQLWKIDIIKDPRAESPSGMVARLTLRHTYMPKLKVDFAGPSYFGGKNNELVLCAGKAGDIHIWDQESAALLHLIRAKAHGGDLTCLAWNHAAEDPYMFATGSHDGGVRIWTRLPDEFDPTHTADLPLPRPRSLHTPWGGLSPRSASPEDDDGDAEDDTSQISERGSITGGGGGGWGHRKGPPPPLSFTSSESSR